jgi:hypothetical protein
MHIATDDEELLDTRDLQSRKAGSSSFYEKKRLTGDGPPYFKIGRKVIYRWGDVRAWLEQYRRTSTSQTTRGAK